MPLTPASIARSPQAAAAPATRGPRGATVITHLPAHQTRRWPQPWKDKSGTQEQKNTKHASSTRFAQLANTRLPLLSFLTISQATRRDLLTQEAQWAKNKHTCPIHTLQPNPPTPIREKSVTCSAHDHSIALCHSDVEQEPYNTLFFPRAFLPRLKTERFVCRRHWRAMLRLAGRESHLTHSFGRP